MKRIKRIVYVPCPDCLGTGLEVGGKCSTCKGQCNVPRVVVEIVHEDNVASESGVAA